MIVENDVPKNPHAAGVQMACQALKNGREPIFAMSEKGPSEDERQYAIGWNCIWASEDNQLRLSNVVIDPGHYIADAKGHFDLEMVARIRAFVEQNGGSKNYLQLNYTR